MWHTKDPYVVDLQLYQWKMSASPHTREQFSKGKNDIIQTNKQKKPRYQKLSRKINISLSKTLRKIDIS